MQTASSPSAMDIQILSDLHLESPKAYEIFEIVPTSQYLALLGDIGLVVAHKDDCLAFLTRQLRQFKAVLFVPGNHEAYGSSWDATLDVLRAFEETAHNDPSLGEFVLLDRANYRLPGTDIVVLGCSLFSSIPPESRMAVGLGLNDFFQTASWSPDAHHDMHRRDIAWLNAQVAEIEQSDVSIMIFSHWSPSLDARSIDPRHAGSSITSAFCTDLSKEACFMSKNVKLWAFGHTHYNCDFLVDRGVTVPLRLVTNQRGYSFSQAKGFDAAKAVSV